jgi:hypothetical protein
VIFLVGPNLDRMADLGHVYGVRNRRLACKGGQHRRSRHGHCSATDPAHRDADKQQARRKGVFLPAPRRERGSQSRGHDLRQHRVIQGAQRRILREPGAHLLALGGPLREKRFYLGTLRLRQRAIDVCVQLSFIHRSHFTTFSGAVA